MSRTSPLAELLGSPDSISVYKSGPATLAFLAVEALARGQSAVVVAPGINDLNRIAALLELLTPPAPGSLWGASFMALPSYAPGRASHDLSRLGLPEAENPAVERLRAEYGAVLADMIVDSLAGQELSRRHLGVTDAELAKAEAVVRADYPGDAFGRMLLEEHIALERWREALRDRLTVEKFAREVLGPHVEQGKLFCRQCRDASPGVRQYLGPGALALMALAVSGQPEAWAACRPDPAAGREFSRTVDLLVRYHLGLAWRNDPWPIINPP